MGAALRALKAGGVRNDQSRAKGCQMCGGYCNRVYFIEMQKKGAKAFHTGYIMYIEILQK